MFGFVLHQYICNVKKNKGIIIWLFSGVFLIYIMVVVGGITRLTGSGLSMADWKPLLGVFPPTTEEAWQEKFELYQNTPEFKIKNAHFTLVEFKQIFWWEFIHRDLGRLIGMVFMIPFLIFWVRKKLDKKLLRKLLLLLFLGGFQGFLGWFMVSSGLVDKPHVSHFRLAAHFVTALTALLYALWLALDLLFPNHVENKKVNRWSKILFPFVLLQLVYGAFTAGLKAGFGNFGFADVFGLPVEFGDVLNNHATVLFIHRYIGIALYVAITLFVFKTYRKSVTVIRGGLAFLLFAINLQFLLGVLTLLNSVPVLLGVLHQAGSVLVVSGIIYLINLSRNRS